MARHSARDWRSALAAEIGAIIKMAARGSERSLTLPAAAAVAAGGIDHASARCYRDW